MLLKVFSYLFVLKHCLANNVPKIYVYDDPVLDWSYLVECYEEKYNVSPYLDERVEHAQNTGEIWMHQSALVYSNRVYDPESADLFYVPMYIALSSDMDIRSGSLTCRGKSHAERMHEALDFLQKSEYFSVRGGNDHIITCTWFWCGHAIGDRGRVVLSRTIIGINEANNKWAMWECRNKVFTVPYTASSVVTNNKNNLAISNSTMESRTIPFYFAGTSRNQPDRKNLAIVSDIDSRSEIHITDNSFTWDQSPEEFATTVIKSRFCFAPRGDTLSSRRLFDAVAAGCIPVVTDVQIKKGVVPFADILNYRKFCIVVNSSCFSNKHRLRRLVNGLLSMKEDRYNFFHSNLNDARQYLIYGNTDGKSMFPKRGVFKSFAVMTWKKLQKDGMWHCNPQPFYEPHARRVFTDYFPPTGESVKNWSDNDELTISRENLLVICSPEYSNSGYVQNFMRDVLDESNWEGKHVTDNGFDVLRIEDYEFHEAFTELEWTKAIYTRDPVVRILDAYLSEIGAWDVEGFQRFVFDLHSSKVPMTGATRPISKQCGFEFVHYGTVIPSESEFTGKIFTGSLREPMRSVGKRLSLYRKDKVREDILSCELSKFYNEITLDFVYEIYDTDYQAFKYEKDWLQVLKKC